jgi:hypothetical protein
VQAFADEKAENTMLSLSGIPVPMTAITNAPTLRNKLSAG